MKYLSLLTCMIAASSFGVKAANFPPSIWNTSVDPMTDYKNNLGYPLQYPFERLFPVEQIPQFVIITIDDNLSTNRVKPTADYLMSIQKKDARGCTPKMTMFVSFDYTMCGLLQQLQRAKHEMATHTLSHEGYPDMREIEGGFQGQVACGTPADEVIGFRTPYLTYNQTVLNDLHTLQGKFGRTLYDSSVVLDGFGPTDYGRKNFWPWKWEHAQKVIYNRETPFANPAPHIEWRNFDPVNASKLTGMWEITMPLYFEPGTNTNFYQNMDYPYSHEIMWDNFYRRYNGNRSPFHINCHSPWLEKNGASLKLWIEQLLTERDDVFFITNKQLLEYMENPVPLSEYKQQRICDAPGYNDSYCFPENYSCNWWSQDWDGVSCSCVCKPGFCMRDGVCYNWNCPAPTAPVAPVAPSPVAPVIPVAPSPAAPVTPVAPTSPTPATPTAPTSIWNTTVDPMTDYKNNLGYPLQYPFERLFPVSQIPQFVVITIDDNISENRIKPTADYLMSIQKKDARGCKPKITMFVSFDYTMCGLLRELYKAKHEMATHTLSHEGYPSKTQIDGGFQGQVACGTPAGEVIGYRTPYLTYDQRVLNDLYALQGQYGRALYDSSVVVDGFAPTDYGRKNFWPWKWEHAQKVIYNPATPNANPSPHIEWRNFNAVNASKMTGMWEIPMPLYFEPGTNTNYYNNMDYPFSHEIMWDNFNRRYNGNRSPFHINCHSPWLDKNGASLKLWIEQLLTERDDVFFVTNKQLLEYMENPVPLSEYKQQRICDVPGYNDSYCFPDNYSCNWWSEDWDSESCSCKCKKGFCLRDGSCVDWNCPAPTAPVAPSPVAPVTPVAPSPVAPVTPVAPSPVAPETPVAPSPVAPVSVPSPTDTAEANVVFPFSRLPFPEIPTSQTPQFITITFDDSVNPYTSFLFSKIAKTIDPHTGCNLKATFYVSIEGTNTKCEFIQGLRQGGHEIGTHTRDHIALPNMTQIQGAIDWLSNECGVPAGEMRGFRTPFLNWDDTTLQNLHKLGFLYDSSIGPVDHTANLRGSNHTWPFTLEKPNIDKFQTVKPSVQISPAPGLWEIPMWSLYGPDNQAEIPMDYPNPKGGDAVIKDLIDPNFLKHYNGNRAPLGLFFHASWLVANGDAFAAWIQKVMDAYDDVFFVTSYEVIQWMQNPVPVSQYKQSCPNQKFCLAPRENGCLFGKFNGVTCQCDCTAPYCRGPDGACTQSTNCPVVPTAPTAPAPVAAPYAGSGCCSGSFKSCDATYCGSTETECKTNCGTDVTWLANGPLTDCKPKTWGCSADQDCCDGLKCLVGTCTPGVRESTPVGSPVGTPVASPAGTPVSSPVSSPVGAPTPTYNGPGCCSGSFKSCDATWCGSTETACNTCNGEFRWLANGALTNCNAKTWGCSADKDCCDGLKCLGGSCTPGTRDSTPVASPAGSPVASPTPSGCCSESYKNCDTTRCGTTEAACKSCDGDFKWLATGALTNCKAKTWGCSADKDCCTGLKCSAGACTPGDRESSTAAPKPVFSACKPSNKKRTRGRNSR